MTTYLHNAGFTWKSYQEDIDTDSAGNVLPQSQWISPITNRSGTYTTVANSYNGSKQYDYAVKHNPPAFFTDTNGGYNLTSTNPAAHSLRAAATAADRPEQQYRRRLQLDHAQPVQRHAHSLCRAATKA